MIARATVKHVAELARLSLDDAEVDAFTGELAAIVRYVEQLHQVDTEGVAPVTLPMGLAPWRADQPVPSLSHEDALAQAPATNDDGFAVPGFVRRS